jgi:hypothetical protein
MWSQCEQAVGACFSYCGPALTGSAESPPPAVQGPLQASAERCLVIMNMSGTEIALYPPQHLQRNLNLIRSSTLHRMRVKARGPSTSTRLRPGSPRVPAGAGRTLIAQSPILGAGTRNTGEHALRTDRMSQRHSKIERGARDASRDFRRRCGALRAAQDWGRRGRGTRTPTISRT